MKIIQCISCGEIFPSFGDLCFLTSSHVNFVIYLFIY